MINLSRVGARAFAVAAVICVPLLAYQALSEKPSTDPNEYYTIAPVIKDSELSEPELGAAIPEEVEWTILPNIKNGRFESTAIQYRDDIYVFNGFALGIKVEQAIEKFDAGTQKWSVIGNTSTATGTGVTHNGTVVVGNEVWMLGGRVGDHPGGVTANVWKFNLNTYQWSKGPKLPTPSAAGGAALVDNRIHWFGGIDTKASCDVDNHFVYDLDNPSEGWKNISGIAPMPMPRNHFATVVHDGLIYAIGGQFTHDGCGAGTPDTDVVHVFNPETNHWKQVASLPAIQSHIEPSTFVYKEAIYVVGGATSGNKIYRYDPSGDDWDTVAQLPQALLAPIARVIDDRLIVSSGGAPLTIPSMATYSTDMIPLLLPGMADTNDDDDLFQPDIPDADTDFAEPGLVSLEAEYQDTLSTTATHKWVSINRTGASNNSAMITTPDNNALANSENNSPSMAYFAYFDRPGKWYLWIRGWGDADGEGRSDSLHAGLNGSLSTTADKIDNFPSGWNWTNSTRDGVRASLDIPTAGIHAVNLWMREDGLAVDKVILTTDADFQPTGVGDEPSDNPTDLDDNDSTITDTGGTPTPDVVDDETPSEPDDVEGTTPDSIDDDTAGETDTGTVNTDTDSDDTGTVTGGTAGDSVTSVAGIVAVEIEDFDFSTAASNKQWVAASNAGASGGASMVTPNTGLLKSGSQGSPVMNYKVRFSQAGTYTVWLRGWGDTVGSEGKNDSVHVGINGTLGSAAAIQNFPSGWHWSSEKRSGGTATIKVPSAGLHTINIWMREDGLILDKLILASDATYTPSGLGTEVTSSVGSADTTDDDDANNTVDDTSTDTNSDTATGAVSDSSLLSVEVESYATKAGDGAHSWLENSKAGASGISMEATPNSGKLSGSANSAVMNYPLQFVEAGTYNVWLRGFGDSNSAGKNDSVYVSLNGNFNSAQVLENFPNGWAWSNQKRGGGTVTVNIPAAGVHVINLSMREDGLILDKLILTKDKTYVPVNLGAAATAVVTPVTDTPETTIPDSDADSETAADAQASNATITDSFVAVRIEAEDFTSKNDRWVLTSPGNIPDFVDDPDGPHHNSASGNANLELLPDTRATHDDPLSGGPNGGFWSKPGAGPTIDYLVNIPQAGRYLVYVKMFSSGTEDNGIHVGINDTKPESGERIQSCTKNGWIWTSAQRTDEVHCGVKKQIWLDVPVAGANKITFYAREDGFEIDQFLLLKETHGGTQDCFPKLNDDIRCESAANGATLSDTDVPVSRTVGSSDATSGDANTTDDTSTDDVAINNNFGNRWQRQYTSDGSEVQPRHEAGGVFMNGKLYVLGGRGSRNVSVYDPGANKWFQKATSPIVLNHFQPVAYNNKIWVIGAFTGNYPSEKSVADIYTYTPSSDKWEKQGTIPQSRRRGSTGAVMHNGLIYIVGGNTNGHKPGAKAWLDSFNPSTGQWKVLSDAPIARDHITASVSNNKLVVAAGRQSAYPNTFANTVSATSVYDFNTNKWSSGKSIPTDRAGAMTVTVGQEVVVIGGEVGDATFAKNTVESYNVVSNTWRKLSSLLVGRHSGIAAVIGNKIHVISGSEKRGGSPESNVHETLNF